MGCYSEFATGFDGIKNALPQSVRVIPGMTTMGTIAYYLTVDSGKVHLDKETAH